MKTCTIVNARIANPNNRRPCGRPAVAEYDVKTDRGELHVCRCARHDPETHARFKQGVGGLVARRELPVFTNNPRVRP